MRALRQSMVAFAGALAVAGGCQEAPKGPPDAAELLRMLAAKMYEAGSARGKVEFKHDTERMTAEFKLLRPNLLSFVTPDFELHNTADAAFMYQPKEKVFLKTPAPAQTMGYAQLLFGFDSLLKEKEEQPQTKGKAREGFFRGKRAYVVPIESAALPGSQVSLYVDRESLMPLGWEARRDDKQLFAAYQDVTLGGLKSEDFAWSPPEGAKPLDLAVGQESAPRLLQVGTTAPEFTLNTPDGKPLALSSARAGKKATIVNFWFYG